MQRNDRKRKCATVGPCHAVRLVFFLHICQSFVAGATLASARTALPNLVGVSAFVIAVIPAPVVIFAVIMRSIEGHISATNSGNRGVSNGAGTLGVLS